MTLPVERLETHSHDISFPLPLLPFGDQRHQLFGAQQPPNVKQRHQSMDHETNRDQ